MPRLIELMVEYTRDTEAAIEARRKYWAGGFVYNQKIYTPKMSQENGEVVGPDTIKKSACISANPEDHVKFIQQYIDLGFNYLIFHSAGPNHRAFIEGLVDSCHFCRSIVYFSYLLDEEKKRSMAKAKQEQKLFRLSQAAHEL